MEEECKAEGRAVDLANEGFAGGFWAKEVFVEVGGGGDGLLDRLLVFGELADEIKNEWHVGGSCWANAVHAASVSGRIGRVGK